VFELGFFYGKLSRSNVCVLLSGGVRRPSDIDGVVYVDMEQNEWRLKLAKEMKVAGLDVDLNEAL
jgi:predicted nucleotide-binding protein